MSALALRTVIPTGGFTRSGTDIRDNEDRSGCEEPGSHGPGRTSRPKSGEDQPSAGPPVPGDTDHRSEMSTKEVELLCSREKRGEEQLREWSEKCEWTKMSGSRCVDRGGDRVCGEGDRRRGFDTRTSRRVTAGGSVYPEGVGWLRRKVQGKA